MNAVSCLKNLARGYALRLTSNKSLRKEVYGGRGRGAALQQSIIVGEAGEEASRTYAMSFVGYILIIEGD